MKHGILNAVLLALYEGVFLALANLALKEAVHIGLLIFEMLCVSTAAFLYNRYQVVMWPKIFAFVNKKIVWIKSIFKK